MAAEEADVAAFREALLADPRLAGPYTHLPLPTLFRGHLSAVRLPLDDTH